MTEQQKVAAEQQQAAQQQIREQVQAAENILYNNLRTWNNMFAATADMAFSMAERTLHYNGELVGQFDRATLEGIEIWRRLWQDNLRTWQHYLRDLTEITNTSAQNGVRTTTRPPVRSR